MGAAAPTDFEAGSFFPQFSYKNPFSNGFGSLYENLHPQFLNSNEVPVTVLSPKILDIYVSRLLQGPL